MKTTKIFSESKHDLGSMKMSPQQQNLINYWNKDFAACLVIIYIGTKQQWNFHKNKNKLMLTWLVFMLQSLYPIIFVV
jgi:hypothetical protein